MKPTREVLLPVALLLAIGLTFTALVYTLVGRSNERQLDEALGKATQAAQRYAVERMSDYEHGLRGVRGALTMVGEQAFNHALLLRYLQGRDSLSEFVGAHGFGLIRRVPENQLAQLQARVGAEMGMDFPLRQWQPHAGERYVIQYVEPLAANLNGPGMDVSSEPVRRAAAQAAMRTGRPMMTAPVALQLEQGPSSPAMLLFLPIYSQAMAATDSVQREQSLIGWSFASLIMAQVLPELPLPPGSQLVIRDVTDGTQPAAVLTQGAQPEGDELRHWLEYAGIYGRQWQFDLVTGPLFAASLHLLPPLLVLLGGALFTLALCGCGAVLAMSSIRRNRLMQVQLRLAAIVESSTDGIISKDLDGVVTSWNKGAEGIFGYSAQQAIGQRLDTLIIEPARVDEERQILRRIRQGQDISNFDTVRHRKDGTRVDVSVNISPIRGADGEVMGASKTVRDISRQKQAEAHILELNASLEARIAERTEQLRATNLMLTSVLRSATEVAIIAAGSDGLIRIFNAGAERMLGFTAEDVVGQATPKMFHAPEELEQQAAEDDFDTLVRQCRTDAASTRQWTFVRKDGSRFPVTLMVTEIRDEQGELTGYLGIAVDITAQRQLQASLQDAKEKADAGSQAKSTFLANMSHEIRTPLNAVLGMLQLLERAALDGRQAGYVGNAQTAARSLLSLLNDILDYSKIEAGKLQLEVHGFDLDQLLRELAVILAGNQANKQVQVLFEIDPQMIFHLLGDSLRLQQVLINLAGNALKFTAQGQVVVRIRRLASPAEAVRARFEVQDTGIGISDRHLGHIFEGFSQAQASTTRRYGGTGLGLAICRRLVALMGGELLVRSEVGQGSCFWFDIDLAVDPVQSAPNDPMALPHGLRVLVVDDNEVARQILTRMVQGLGWQVDAVASGSAALERAREQQARGSGYDVVLMDWNMPDMDGLTAARWLVEGAGGASVAAVIMVTAYSRETLGQLDAGEQAPFRALLSKPVTPRQLAQAVQAALAPVGVAGPAGAPLPGAGKPLSGLRLLVVEDNALNREVARELLAQEGAHVELAHGGLDGVARLTEQGLQVDAVLMDIQMPDIDGFEATRRLRADPRFQQLPIIAMTANVSADDQRASLAAGMNAHLAKPIDLPKVIATVQQLTQRRVSVPAAPVLEAQGIVEPMAPLLARLGGNRRLLASLVERLEPEVRGLQSALHQAQADNDRPAAQRLLHTLKGTAGNLGARALSQRAGELEQGLRDCPQLALGELLSAPVLGDLERLVTLSVEQLSESVGRQVAAPQPVTLTQAAFRQHLETILPLLHSHNLRGVTLVEALQAHQLPCERQAWARLNEHLLTLDFKAAAGVVGEMLRA